MRQTRNQKELNTLVNTAVQRVLTEKNTPVQTILDELSDDWAAIVYDE